MKIAGNCFRLKLDFLKPEYDTKKWILRDIWSVNALDRV